jgi:hypothetical protein
MKVVYVSLVIFVFYAESRPGPAGESFAVRQ